MRASARFIGIAIAIASFTATSYADTIVVDPDAPSPNDQAISTFILVVLVKGVGFDAGSLDHLVIERTQPADYTVRYASNLQAGDSIVNITNTGANGSPLFGPGFGTPAGNLCVNVYAFSPDEQMVS